MRLNRQPAEITWALARLLESTSPLPSMGLARVRATSQQRRGWIEGDSDSIRSRAWHRYGKCDGLEKYCGSDARKAALYEQPVVTKNYSTRVAAIERLWQLRNPSVVETIRQWESFSQSTACRKREDKRRHVRTRLIIGADRTEMVWHKNAVFQFVTSKQCLSVRSRASMSGQHKKHEKNIARTPQNRREAEMRAAAK